ncbi:restriction endonuclease subunit S [Staphylococcus delphini]|uniref:restriction endonuclease subunit S n=1 Tax=Staphylococcus delphini TaxID=53344 RepID=UPI000BBC10CA|nr:restriction endonuclease subunit S [Staphylococcus delphini]PCF83858.1 hypothetical protein B4W69_07235 [Staphylococcus delphini]
MTDLKRNVPELRFPEFEGEWEEKKLGELCTFSNGINAKKEQYGHGRKFINVLDILNKNYITYNEIIGKVAVSKEVEHRNKVEYGDLLFLRSSETREEVGTTNVYLDNTFALYGGFVIRGKKVANYDPMFIKNLLNTSKIRNMISASSGGSTRYNVNQEILKKLKLKLTGINEQQKIGDFFSKLDRQIELEEQKLALLEEQKKGYVQKIFSQELRFKDDNGEDYPEWEEKELKSLVEYKNGKGYEKEVDPNGKYNIINLNSISTKGRLKDSGKYSNFKDTTLNKNDLVMILSDVAKGNLIGKTAIIDQSDKYLLNQRVASLRVREVSITNIVFVYYYINYFRWYFINMSTGMSQLNISKRTVEEFLIHLPHIEEQQKIGDFFSKLDQQIELQGQKIENLKQRKKGLLQKMFV